MKEAYSSAFFIKAKTGPIGKDFDNIRIKTFLADMAVEEDHTKSVCQCRSRHIDDQNIVQLLQAVTLWQVITKRQFSQLEGQAGRFSLVPFTSSDGINSVLYIEFDPSSG